MIQALLQRWSELEPSRCDYQSVSYWLASVGYAIPFERLTTIDQSILLSAVLDAIVARNLRMQLENSVASLHGDVPDGWRVVLLHPDEVGAAIQVMSSERSTALLRAYLEWLEKQEKPP